jgi:hypothetical protein
MSELPPTLRLPDQVKAGWGGTFTRRASALTDRNNAALSAAS